MCAGPASQRLSLASFCSLKKIICKDKLLKEWLPSSCLQMVLFIPVLWLFFGFLLYCLFESAAGCITTFRFYLVLSQCAQLQGNPQIQESHLGFTGVSITEFWGFLISFSNQDFLFPSLSWIYRLVKKKYRMLSLVCFIFFNHSKKRQNFLLVQVFSSFTSEYWMRNLKKNLYNLVTDMEGNVPRYLAAGLLLY